MDKKILKNMKKHSKILIFLCIIIYRKKWRLVEKNSSKPKNPGRGRPKKKGFKDILRK